MKLFFISILLTVVGNVAYHVAQKSVPVHANPIVSLLVAYGVAFLVCLLILPFYPHVISPAQPTRVINGASIAIGLGIVAIELGFLLAYRAGWKLNAAGIVTSASVTILLIPVGLFFFKESFTSVKAFGVALCLLGLALLVRAN